MADKGIWDRIRSFFEPISFLSINSLIYLLAGTIDSSGNFFIRKRRQITIYYSRR